MKDSTDSLQDNVDDGGHVWQHIGNLKSKPNRTKNGDTQLDKSLFRDEDDFYAAWDDLHDEYLDYARCEKKYDYTTVGDCVRASDLGIYTAYECTDVDVNDLCTKWTEFEPNSVRFWYYRYTRYSIWILRTAYPSRKYC